MSSAFRDDLEAARSRADALREENEELREEVARLRAQPPAEAQPLIAQPLVDRGPDSLTARTLARLEQLIEHGDDAPAPTEEPEPARVEQPSRPRPRAPEAHSPPPAGDRALPATPLLNNQLHLLERQLAEATRERDELRAGRGRHGRSFWIGVALGLALGVLIATVLR